MNKTFKIACLFGIILTANLLMAHSPSRVEEKMVYSYAVQNKLFYKVYLPEGYDNADERYPVVYFLNSQDHDWFNPYIAGRDGNTLKLIADSLISCGQIGKMILIVPGFVNMGVNMLRPDFISMQESDSGGQYENYFVDELIPLIDASYRTIPERSQRGIDGFDLGGYGSILMGVKHPELFCSIGSYNAPVMWQDLDDPMTSEHGDDVYWMSPENDSFLSPTFDKPRNTDYMLQNNACNILMAMDETDLEIIQSSRFHIQASNPNGFDTYEVIHSSGRISRNARFINTLKSIGISNSFEDLSLTVGATNDWKYADLHASQSLLKHWETFQNVTALTKKERQPSTVTLSANYPNPFNPSTQIKFSLATATHVTLDVFNIQGQRVMTLVNGEQRAGEHQVTFNANGLASGTYVYRLKTNNFMDTKRMTLIR
jgi:S-formylglutathione hydrolase FrmB